MKQAESFDVIILGAGVSGLAVADSLTNAGYQCAIIDSGYPGAGASGAPMMLVNPASGRRARKSWRAEECFSDLESCLINIEKTTGIRCYSKNRIVRPALSMKIAEDFKRSPAKYDWLPGWIEWIEPADFRAEYPYFNCDFGGLNIKKSFTIKGDQFCESMINYLEVKGCFTLFGSEPELIQIGKQWLVRFEDGTHMVSPVVIDATGYHQPGNKIWSFIPLHPVKGQTVTLYFDQPIGFNHSVSSLGYIAVMPEEPLQLTVGSTYEHDFDHIKPDSEGLSYLRGKLENTLPGYWNKTREIRQWASVRVSVQDKMPVIGMHPEHEGLYMIGALGSKGLLMSRYVAELLTQNISNGVPIHHSVSISRFL